MGQVTARGQLRHCFFGTYQAQIALAFHDKKSASDARKVLGEAWKMCQDTRGLMWQGAEPALEKVLDKLESFGADRKKVTSLAKNIDFGEPFEVVIEVVPGEQGKLYNSMSK